MQSFTADTTRTRKVVSLHADNDPALQNPKEFSLFFRVAQWCDEESVSMSRNIFSVTQKISTKTGGSYIQMDLGTRGQEDPGAGINFINDKIIIRRIATLVSEPAARTPSWHVRKTSHG